MQTFASTTNVNMPDDSLSVLVAPASKPQAQATSSVVVAALGFASELRVPPAAEAFKTIHLESASEKSDFAAYLAKMTNFASTIETPLASLSLEPRALLATSASTGGSSENPVQQPAVNRFTATADGGRPATAVAGRVDGVLLPDLDSLELVVTPQHPSPLENMSAPMGKILQAIKLGGATTPDVLQLAA